MPPQSTDPEPASEGRSPGEPHTQPGEARIQQIRAALVAAVCDGAHEPFSDAALGAQRDATVRLRELVHTYVTYLRSRGTPPERAVGFMKGLVRDTEIPCHRPLLDLENKIMHWSIDAYYSLHDEGRQG